MIEKDGLLVNVSIDRCTAVPRTAPPKTTDAPTRPLEDPVIPEAEDETEYWIETLLKHEERRDGVWCKVR